MVPVWVGIKTAEQGTVSSACTTTSEMASGAFVARAGRRAGDPAEVIADASRIRSRLDWTPSRDDLELILRTAIAWEKSLEAVAA